jgi:hypothetical protein
MGSVLSIVATVFGFIPSGIQFVWSMLRDWVYQVKATHIIVQGDAISRPIRPQRPPVVVPVNVPIATKIITVHGTYRFHPNDAAYFLFVRKGKDYWPQGQVNFSSVKSWDAQVNFGATGTHHILLVRLSPEIKVLCDYYREASHELELERNHLIQALPEANKNLVAQHIHNWRAIKITQKLKGLRILQEFDVVVGP